MRLGLVLRALAVLLAFIVVALVAAAKSTDPAVTRDAMVGWLSASLGKKVEIGGQWHLKLGLSPRLWAEQVTLSPGIQARRVEAELALFPLLRRDVRVTRLVLHDLALSYRHDDVISLKPRALPVDWASLREIRLINAHIQHLPAQGAEQSITINRLFLRAQPGIITRLSLDGTGSIDGRAFAIDGQLDNPLIHSGTKGWSVRVKGNYDGMVGQVDGQLPPISGGNGLDLALSLQADDAASAARLLGWDIPPVGPMKLATRLGGDWHHLSAKDVELVAGRRDGWRLTAKGQLGQIMPLSAMDMLVQAEREGNGTNLTGLKLSSLIQGGGDDWRFNDLSMQLAGLQSRGALTLSLAGARPRVSGTLGFDQLDFSGPLPITILWTGLDGQVQMQAKSVRIGQQIFEQATATLGLQPGIMSLSKIRAKGWGGQVQADLSINHAHSPANLSLTLSGDQLRAADLLRGHGDHSWQDALASIRLTAIGRGDNVPTMIQSLNGQSMVTLSPAMPGASLRCAAALFQLNGPVATTQALVVENGKSVMGGTIRLDMAQDDLDIRFAAPNRGLRTCRDVTSLKFKS